MYHTYIQTGLWTPPADRLYRLLGPFGVSIFFMITGFLFWAKMIDESGRPNWTKLYVGRVFRIGPIYLFVVSIMFLTVFALTAWRVQQSAGDLIRSIVEWADLGWTSGLPINGIAKPGILLANVTWSLHWEWLFYFSLFATAYFARNRKTALAFPTLSLVAALCVLFLQGNGTQWGLSAAFIALFCVGMLTAASKAIVAKIAFGTVGWSMAAAVAILVVLTFFSTIYSVVAIGLLGAAFFLIANGASLFGLLNSRPARRLGDISFAMYLLQGLALAAAFAPKQIRMLALTDPVNHWLLVAATGIVLVVASTVAHTLIERPGIDAGRWLLRTMSGGERPLANGAK